MAEFRKREDINQELDILQTWSEMGAPRIGDVSRSLQSLVKTVDPRLMTEMTPSSVDLDVSAEPPEFANLPPGDEEGERNRRVLPILAALLLLGSAALFLMAKWDALFPTAQPSPEPSDDLGEHPPTEEPPLVMATPMPSALPSILPSVMATPSPAPTAEPTPSPEPTPRPTATPHAAAHPTQVPPPPSVPPVASPEVTKAPPAAPTATPAVTASVPPAAPEQTYVVRPGDSLYGIAKAQLGDGDRWNEIYEANRDTVMVPNLITPGTELKLPGGEAAAPVAPARPQTYTVQPGDSLSWIAERHLGDAGRWPELYELNRDRLTSPQIVHPGTRLRLPAAAGAPAGAHRRPALSQQKTLSHRVAPGESLSLLAKRYLGSAGRWQEIYYLNSHKIANPHWIYPGQVLSIPVGGRRAAGVRYVVRSGDTLWAISGKMSGDPNDWQSLYQANQGKIRNPHLIYPGQVFVVPR